MGIEMEETAAVGNGRQISDRERNKERERERTTQEKREENGTKR